MKLKVKDSGSLYRDEESGAILNCSNTQYDEYLKLKEQKMKEVSEMDKLKDDVDAVSYTHLTLPTKRIV